MKDPSPSDSAAPILENERARTALEEERVRADDHLGRERELVDASFGVLEVRAPGSFSERTARIALRDRIRKQREELDGLRAGDRRATDDALHEKTEIDPASDRVNDVDLETPSDASSSVTSLHAMLTELEKIVRALQTIRASSDRLSEVYDPILDAADVAHASAGRILELANELLDPDDRRARVDRSSVLENPGVK